MESGKIEIGMYLNLMQEIKNRIHSILDICIYHKRTTSFNQTNTEFKRSGDGSLIRLTLNRREYCKSGNMTQEERWFRLFSG